MRDVVRCRETFQREILKSRHYILKFRQTSRASSARWNTGSHSYFADIARIRLPSSLPSSQITTPPSPRSRTYRTFSRTDWGSS